MQWDEDGEVGMIPINRINDEPRTPEQEALFKKLIQAMREEGRRAKGINEEEMTACFYCETNTSSKVRHSEPICDDCFGEEFSSIDDPKIEQKMSERDKADRLKGLIALFNHDKVLRKCADPDKLMDWLKKRTEKIDTKDRFKFFCDEFTKEWERSFGSAEDIPQSFKDFMNNKYKGLR